MGLTETLDQLACEDYFGNPALSHAANTIAEAYNSLSNACQKTLTGGDAH
jgi:hypothetical protein